MNKSNFEQWLDEIDLINLVSIIIDDVVRTVSAINNDGDLNKFLKQNSNTRLGAYLLNVAFTNYKKGDMENLKMINGAAMIIRVLTEYSKTHDMKQNKIAIPEQSWN